MVLNIEKEDYNKSGIYIITNLVNGKYYIGSTYKFIKRYGDHKNYLLKNNHANRYLQDSYKKYGSENFTFEVLDYVEKLEDLLIIEGMYLIILETTNRNVGYNMRKFPNSPLGIKWSEESKLKFSDSQKGKIPVNRKLTEQDVFEIKHLILENKMTFTEIGKKYGVYHTTITKIKNNEIWKTVDIGHDLKSINSKKHNGAPKLTPDDVLHIKKLLFCDKKSVSIVAKETNLSKNTILNIRDGRTYSSIILENEDTLKKDIKLIRSLTEEEVLKIKIHLFKKDISSGEICKNFNISHGNLYNIKHGKSWSHIKLDEENNNSN